MKLHGTIDSVSMQHLCRPPIIKVQTKKGGKDELGLELITRAVAGKKFVVFIDEKFGLSDEWKKTCGFENIEPILTRWIESEGVTLCNAEAAKVPRQLSKQLKDASFVDTGDKLIVRIGLAAVSGHNATAFLIATNDSDFWDPLDKSKAGKGTAPVASALAAHNIHSTQLKSLFTLLTK